MGVIYKNLFIVQPILKILKSIFGGEKISSTTVTANNEWLVWARKTANYNKEEIAKKMNVNIDVIEKWENTGNISYDKLVEIANYYQRPPNMFFNVKKPTYDEPITDLRTIQSKRVYKLTPQMTFEFRDAKIKRLNLLDLETEMEDLTITDFAFKNIQYKDPYKIAVIVSNQIGMNANRRKREKLTYWIDRVEQLGVLVFQFYGIDVEYMRGYALYYDKLPIIGINNKEHENGQKFTLFHELAHLILKSEGFSNLNNYFLPNTEKKCNKLAAEILIPSNDLDYKMSFYHNITNEKLRIIIPKLANHYKVSKEVVVRRLLDNGYLNHEYYLNKEEWDSFIAQKKRNIPIKDDTSEKEEITDKPVENEIKNVESEEIDEVIEKIADNTKYRGKATEALRRNGKFYTKSVLEAYHENAIQIDDVLNFLDIPLEVFYVIKQKMYSEEES